MASENICSITWPILSSHVKDIALVLVVIYIFTARNEVAAKLCFHRRLWFCSQGGGGMHDGGHMWKGACVVGGMHGGGEHVWQGACMAGGVHGGHVWHRAWMTGGMHDRRDSHCSGRYAPYWNAFLFKIKIIEALKLSFQIKICHILLYLTLR